MGADPNRSGGHAIQQQRDARRANSGIETLAVEQAATSTAGQSARACEPITMRVPDACRYIGISRSTLYLLIAKSEVEIIKLGSSTLVLTESLKALVARRRIVKADHYVQIDV
ncbi:helix-turn-helix transcriptional regulator [Erythrobacter colymbi]|uniref:helix-turn-helix transcriptional regulator n=1 Tax=Erythrobacter colymbi TaxID=1161202 RepID=UPI001F0A772F|nr:helix-turn-helix domain-containing protein [Erythrobacter colymbi]